MSRMDVLKTMKYMARNGVLSAYYAARERLEARKHPYTFEPECEEVLAKQRKLYLGKDANLGGANPGNGNLQNRNLKNENRMDGKHYPLVSILVPAYETPKQYLQALLDSVCNQTYPFWELLIADASSSDAVRDAVSEYQEKRKQKTGKMDPNETNTVNQNPGEQDQENAPAGEIRYVRLASNEGISGNTNQGLDFTKGEYVALLDHDDLIEPDALHALVQKALETDADLVYSDEDKCDENGGGYNSPHYKEDFNLDMFLTNNYICHFTMIRAGVIKKLRFRPEYDGAQDYDLFLRVLALCGRDKMAHVPKILYHWRCHEGSTAMNPSSKDYAYEAGKEALSDYYRQKGLKVLVKHGKHLGFYDTIYMEKDLFVQRPEIGAVGGPLIQGKYICGGAMTQDGTCLYEGLNKHYSGYMNRADLTRDVEALDLRNIRVRKELQTLPGEILKERPELATDVVGLSLEMSKRIRQKGYLLIYNPRMRQDKTMPVV